MNAAQRERLLSPRQVADELGISRSAVYAAVHTGRLHAIQFGERGSIRIRGRDLHAFLQREKPAA